MRVTVFKSWLLIYASCSGLHFLINLNIVFPSTPAELFFFIELSTLPPRCLLRVVTAKLGPVTADTQSWFSLCYAVMGTKFNQVLFYSNQYHEILLNFQLTAVLTTLKILIESKSFTSSLFFPQVI